MLLSVAALVFLILSRMALFCALMRAASSSFLRFFSSSMRFFCSASSVRIRSISSSESTGLPGIPARDA